MDTFLPASTHVALATSDIAEVAPRMFALFFNDWFVFLFSLMPLSNIVERAENKSMTLKKTKHLDSYCQLNFLSSLGLEKKEIFIYCI